MNNRNPNTTSRTRRDSVSDKERHGMQQGFPVREDAARSFGQSANRPEGPREVPQSLRQGKIPVRKDASTGRTFPVMNRDGQKSAAISMSAPEEPDLTAISADKEAEPEQAVPVPVTEEPEIAGEEPAVEAEPEPMDKEPAPEAEPEPTEEEPAPEAEPEPTEEEPAPEAEPEPTEEEPAPEAEPEPTEEEPAPEAEPESTEEETTAEAEPEPTEEEPAPEAEPEPTEEKPAPATEPVSETQVDEPIEPPVFVQRKRTAAVQPPIPAVPVQAEDPLEATREFEKIPPAAAAAEYPSATPAAADDGPSGSGPKKLWILPLVIAVLAALGLCIGIPALTARKGTPDYDMSEEYEKQETDGTAPETLPEDSLPAKFSVTLTLPGREPVTVSTAEITLEALLDRIGYTIQDSDWFPVDPGALLTEETAITVETIVRTTETETIILPYETIVTEVQTIPRGQKDVTQTGQTGTKVITYAVETVGGREISRTAVDEKITKQPVNETYQLGVGGTLVGNDGKTYSYSYYRIVNATYYDLQGLTYLGYNADESVVAVDKNCIPLGTKLYVKNDQFDFGVRTAADTGSFKGWEVDIWLDDANPQKAAFAQIGYVKNMVIYYLD